MNQYRLAVQVHPDSSDAHNNLATAVVQRGEFGLAVEHLRKALELAEVQNNKPLAAQVRQRLDILRESN
jgi:Flp pilus assembly protein TadD